MIETNRPALFAEENRAFWMVIRRVLIYTLRQIDLWYCTSTTVCDD